MNPENYIKEAVAASARPIVFEVGAAKLEDTPKILELIVGEGKPYDYYAFEPDPRNLEFARASRVYPLINLVATAVGNTVGHASFNQSSGKNPTYGYDHTLSGSLKKPKRHLEAHPWCRFDTAIQVRSMTLDAFAQLYSIPHIDFIWCDVQGAEDLVVEGAQKILTHTRFLYTEYYEIEMYEGQIGIQEILKRLPGTWVVQEVWPNDVIFKNLRFR